MPRGIYTRTKEIKRTEEQCEKNRQSQLKSYQEHPERKIKISKGQLKRFENPLEREKNRKSALGRIVSPELKEKMRQYRLKRKQELGYINSPETREKLRQSNLGKKLSPEQCENISIGLKGKKHTPERIENHRKVMLGRHCSEETKEKIRKANKGQIPSSKCGRGKRSFYLSPLQGEVCFRSSYELAYAKYLDSIGEEYYFEPKAFPMVINGKETTYRPDFYLPNENTFVEIKGWFSPEAQLKVNKFRELYSKNYNFEILFKNDLKKLGGMF